MQLWVSEQDLHSGYKYSEELITSTEDEYFMKDRLLQYLNSTASHWYKEQVYNWFTSENRGNLFCIVNTDNVEDVWELVLSV